MLVTSMSHFYDVLVHIFFFFFSFLYDTLFPGNSVTNVRPFCDEIAFDGGVRDRGSRRKKLNSMLVVLNVKKKKSIEFI